MRPEARTVQQYIDAGVLEIGDGYRAKNSELGTEGIPFARAGNIDEGFSFEGADRFPLESLDLVGPKVSQVGDSLFTSKGTVGRIAFVNEATPRFVYSPQLCYWRSRDAEVLDPKFLNVWMRGSEFSAQVAYLKGQTDMADYVSLRDQRRMTITLPPVREQRRMADIVFSFDEKVALNRRLNQVLEQMAQAIFQAWFVDFVPVRAKVAARAEDRDPLRAAMCALSGKTDAELDAMPSERYEQLAENAALFPDELVDSELGEVPRAWGVKSLPDVMEVNPTRSLKQGTSAPYLDMASVPTNAARITSVTTREFGSGSKFRNGDTLLARITPCLENGKTAFVDFLRDGQVGAGSTEFIVLRPKPPLPEPFGYFLCRHAEFRAFAIANMVGTSGRQRVPSGCFVNYRLVVPDEKVADAFGRFAAECLQHMRARDAESHTLATLRAMLLPKLLSGELPVSPALEPAEEIMG